MLIYNKGKNIKICLKLIILLYISILLTNIVFAQEREPSMTVIKNLNVETILDGGGDFTVKEIIKYINVGPEEGMYDISIQTEYVCEHQDDKYFLNGERVEEEELTNKVLLQKHNTTSIIHEYRAIGNKNKFCRSLNVKPTFKSLNPEEDYIKTIFTQPRF